MKKIIMALVSFTMASSAFALDVVRFAQDIPSNGTHSFMARGVKEGIFAKHGIELQVSIGGGAVKTGIALGSGKVEAGYHDFSGTVIVNSKSEKAKFHTVFVVDDKFQDALWALPDSNIKTWNDIEGKTVAGFLTGTTRMLLPAVTNAQPKFVNTPFPMRAPSLVTKKTDMTEGYLTSMYFDLKKLNVSNAIVFRLGDSMPYAVSKVVSVNTEWAEKNPIVVRRLVSAMRESLNLHLTDPSKSVDALSGPLVATDDLKTIEVERAQYGIQNLILTDFVRQNGISNPTALAPRLDQYISILTTRLNLPYRHKNEDYFRLIGD